MGALMVEMRPDADYVLDLDGNRIIRNLDSEQLRTGMILEGRLSSHFIVVLGDCTGKFGHPYVQREDLKQALAFVLAEVPVDNAYTRAVDMNYDLELTPEDLIDVNGIMKK